MSDFEIEFEGADEIIKNLQKIDADLRGKVAVQAVNAGAIQIENKAKINAPVATGALRNSVRTIARMTTEGAEAEIGFRGLAYARIQEFGGLAGRRHTVKIRGKHYLENAINSEKSLAEKAMADVIRHYLEQ